MATPMQGQWMGQGNWNASGQNGYQMPPITSSSGNAAAPPPPLPSLPPPGSGVIKFTIPSKGSNKLQKPKQEKTPSNIQVLQYPTTTQVTTTKTEATETKNSESTFTSTKFPAMPSDWPESLRRYVERCYSMCKSSVDKDFVELILKGKITSAVREGTAASKDWENEPLPNLSRVCFFKN